MSDKTPGMREFNLAIPEKILFLLDEHRRQEMDIKDVKSLPDLETTVLKGINRFFGIKLAEQGIKTVRDLSLTEIKFKSIDDEALHRWTTTAKILCVYADLKDPTELAGKKRLVLAGIDAAGKTSTLKTLQQMKTVADSRPTPGVAAEKFLFLGHNLSVFDLGGQRTFREMYLKTPDDYFSETILLVFIVDIQSYSRFEEALEYFDEIISVLDLLGERPLISIHFHKFDSDGDATFHANTSHLKVRLNDILQKSGWSNVYQFNTSIFKIRSIVSAFSSVFRAISPMSQVLNDTLRYYSEFHGLQGSYLISSHGMIIAEYAKMAKEDRDQMFEEIYQEITQSPEKVRVPTDMQFGDPGYSTRHVFRSYPTGTYIAISSLDLGDHGHLFIAMLSQDIEQTPTSFGEEFRQSMDLWIRHLFIPT